MRKLLLCVLSVAALSFALTQVASAYPLNHHYSPSELHRLCIKNHGKWNGPGQGSALPGNYSCGKQCSGDLWCVVGCNGTTCTGDCPNCPARIVSGGRKQVVTNILGGGAAARHHSRKPRR